MNDASESNPGPQPAPDFWPPGTPLRQLFDDYLRLYAGRDERLTGLFSEAFSGFTGGGDFLVKVREDWVRITRQDFAQVREPIRIELKDVSLQPLSDTIAVVIGFFVIHLPLPDSVLSRETARLVLVFRLEEPGWRIASSTISIPYHGTRQGEVYPLQELRARNLFLEQLAAERTAQLSAANESLHRANEELKREIAERRQTELALQRSEKLYRSILNASPDDITIADPDGRILMISPMALRMFGGLDTDYYLGRSIVDFLVPEERERARTQILLKRQGVVTGPTEYRALRLDGGTFDIETNSEFIRDASGEPTGLVVIARDITARKREEAEKLKLEALNRQLQKSESLGRMAGAIAHHFNNQLQSVMLGLELTQQETTLDPWTVASLSSAMAAARQAADLSALMLTYLGQSKGRPVTLDLSETAERALALLRAVVPKNVRLECDFPERGPFVRADANQLQQLLANLVTNACEASVAPEASVSVSVGTVAASGVPATHRVPPDWRADAACYACLEVRDRGCGIAETDLEKIFDPFFTTKMTGRGLGLPVALGIVRTQGGAICVASEPGRGSVFQVFLPLSSEALPKAVAAKAPPAGVGTNRTVLVVEDESAVREVVERSLARAGYRVLLAADGVEALEVYGQHGAEIDVVLCDLNMPRMNGWQTLSELRHRNPGLPVILASGYDESQVMAGHQDELPQAFLHKPFQYATLVGTIGQACAAREGG